MSAFLTGFFLGLSLIIAIGAQNTFVFRQGIIGKHVFEVALFCAISDALLIIIGISGISLFVNNLSSNTIEWIFGITAVWLSGYAIIRLKACFTNEIEFVIEKTISKNLLSTLSVTAFLTFLNPHVYLDTVILIGTISQQFSEDGKILFGLGATLASFIFFFCLAYGARLLTPIMQKPSSWRILDGFIAFIMFSLAIKLAYAGNWL